MTVSLMDNILRTYAARTPTEHMAGLTWYDNAHSLALELSPSDPWRGAGVIAAFSPLTPWNRNVELARAMFESRGTLSTGTLSNSLSAARRIHNGEPTLEVLKGDKTRAFASAIADPINSTMATIDRHAFNVAMGTFDNNVSIGRRAFRDCSAAYVDAAFWCDIPVCAMQAITWLTHRRQKGVWQRRDDAF